MPVDDGRAGVQHELGPLPGEEQGGPEAISAAGYTLTTLFSRKDLGI